MDNRPYIKWHCEKLKELLEQGPPTHNGLLLGLHRELDAYVNSCRIEAQVPPGIEVKRE